MLQAKYQELINAASSAGAQNLNVREQDGVLYLDADVPSGSVKDQMWDAYGKIDPDFRSGDLVMNLNVTNLQDGVKAKVVTESSNLNIRKGPGTDQPIVGKASHHEYVTLVSKFNEQWWLVRTDQGEEGYAYAQYLSVE